MQMWSPTLSVGVTALASKRTAQKRAFEHPNVAPSSAAFTIDQYTRWLTPHVISRNRRTIFFWQILAGRVSHATCHARSNWRRRRKEANPSSNGKSVVANNDLTQAAIVISPPPCDITAGSDLATRARARFGRILKSLRSHSKNSKPL